ncbi:MAG: hypothetical protein NW201_01710 [Gemmatimonadales bacterium]|nr:hypothetical protein [Gemmatimonadales bacterium]
MTDGTDEPGLPRDVTDAAKAHLAPPPLDREALWRRIEAARRVPEGGARVVPLATRRRPARTWAAWAVAAVALLAVGIGIGMTLPRWRRGVMPHDLATAPRAEAGAGVPAAYRVTAERHLAQAEAFLTLFRAAARDGRTEALAVATAAELLQANRLLSDSPAADDPRLRPLLDDLELVLAQIATLRGQAGRAELDLITDGLERGVLVQLRAQVTPETDAPTRVRS